MNVILDTNIFVGDFKMKSMSFIVFLEYSRKLPFDIYVPDLVLDEVVTKYREKLIEADNAYNKSVRDINKIILDELDEISLDFELKANKYFEYLKLKFKEYKIQSIPYPQIKHKDVVNYELTRKKPFKNNGSGYRDKLILESIFERFNILSETTVFISSNANDFGKEPDFYNDIIQECKSSNRWNLKISNSLNSFNEVYIKSLIPVDNSNHTIEEFSSYFGKTFGDWFLENLRDVIYDEKLGHELLDLERDYGTVMLSKVDNVKSIKVSNVIEFSDDYITFEVDVDASLIMYISADSTDMLQANSWAEFFDYSPSEGNIDISTWHQVRTMLCFEVVIDSKSKGIKSYNIRKAKTDYADICFR